jgi:hypothetical protein
MKAKVLLLLSFAVLVWPNSVFGQWRDQTVQLRTGWNAVYLSVRPFPDACDIQFANLPVDEVHRFNQRLREAQFDTDPQNSFNRPLEWLTWRRPDDTNVYIRTLERLLGDSTYLVHATTNCTWQVRGRPVLPRFQWVPGRANMVGFQITPSAAEQPTFTDFFRYAPGINAMPDPVAERIYEIGPNLEHTNLTSRANRVAITPGKAYWIQAQGASEYVGPLDIYAGSPDGMVYGSTVNELILRVRNVYGAPLSVTVRHVASAQPPEGSPPLIAEVPLLWANRANAAYTWNSWPLTAFQQRSLATNESWDIRLAVNRGSMMEPPFTNALWQSLIEVSTTNGFWSHVPVSAAYASGTDQVAAFPYGLWVGQAIISAVSFVGFDTNAAGESATEPLPVAGAFPLRLIVHAGSDNSCRLLQHVIVAAVEDAAKNRFTRLYSDESRMPAAATVMSRLSSPAYGRMQPLVLSGGGFLNEVSGEYVMDYNDPLNPFKHLYHQDHDNKDPSTGATLPEGIESYTITNHVRLTWNTNAVSGSYTALWNPDETVTGTYEHTIGNLRLVPIALRGEFKLRRVVRTGVMD